MVTCIEGVSITAEIDGTSIPAPTSYLEKSSLFDVQLLVDNVFGLTESVVPELLLSPSVDEGHFFLVKPLAPGPHVIRFHTSPNGSCGFEMDWTMNLNIGGESMGGSSGMVWIGISSGILSSARRIGKWLIESQYYSRTLEGWNWCLRDCATYSTIDLHEDRRYP